MTAILEKRLSQLIEKRYREAATGAGDWNETLDTILDHRSTRAYLPDALPEGALEVIAAAAQSAPTSSNLQAFSVIAVQDPARKARLSTLGRVNRQIDEAPLLLIWLADLSRARVLARDHGQPGDGLDYLESFLLAVIDATLAAQNATLAIAALGLGSCYIGAMRNHPAEVSAELGLPPETVAIFGLTVGWPDRARASDVKPRLPQAAVLHREQYGQLSAAADLAPYNAALRQFQTEQSMTQVDWTEVVSRRIGTTESLKGRDGLTDTLRALGFKLK